MKMYIITKYYMITFALTQDFVLYSIAIFAIGIALGAYITVGIVAKTNKHSLYHN